MVNTRSRQLDVDDFRDDSSPERNPVVKVSAVIPPGMPPIFTREVERVPWVELAPTNPVVKVVNPQTDMMASIMQMVSTAMEKQQEAFMKMLEDCDTSLIRNEAVVEGVVVGSGGTGPGIRIEEPRLAPGQKSGKICSYKSFLGCGPPEFFGSDDPIVCVKWIRAVEQAFGSAECGDDQRVRFGAQLLRDAALAWWDVTQYTLSPTVLAQLSWAEFKRKLIEEFCSERSMDRIEKEFRSLVKGNLTVREYTRQFMEKLRLVGHVAPTEKDKVKAYLNGLPADMLSMVDNSKASNLRETIEEAQFMEEIFARSKSDKAVVVGDKRKWENNPAPPRRNQPFVGNRGSNNRPEARWCQRCKNKHFGNCNPNATACVKCGKTGHTVRDCPVKGVICFECKTSGHFRRECLMFKTGSAPERKENPPRVPGRAFQMTANEAKSSADVVSGTFLLNSVPARVLFDSGASFSFISVAFREKLVMSTISLENTLVVEIANGSQVLICDVLKDCTLNIEGKKFLINLMPMVIGGFDVVVGTKVPGERMFVLPRLCDRRETREEEARRREGGARIS
ncbi:hypothetical protein L6452_16954 [Arctium lappa]|uniref:Uncharacterized protein n=1 Tax=Arctium lappa TaxID=4217 RepID=A0ACB9C256_ARCLA|nr:hypothetical protein L6452_16954 [Arctium lappa]